MKSLLLSLSLISLAIFAGCASKPIPAEATVQSFSSEAYYQDKKTGKTQQFSLEVIAKKNQKLRMDAKAILGIHIATAVMTLNQLDVAVHPEKKYYEGNASPRSLQKTLGIPLYPLIFHAILYRQNFRGSGWSCELKNNKVSKCSQKPSGMTITWEDQDDATMVVVDSKGFNLQWRISPPENIQEKQSFFEIKVPDSYEKLSLS